MLLRDECQRLWPHPLDWGPLGCPQVQQSPCMVTMPPVEMAAFPFPHSCIPEPVHAINRVAYCALFITDCIIDAFECNPHDFTYSVHCVARYNALVFRSAQRIDMVIRFSEALDFSVGMGGWWKLPKLSLISKRLFSKTQSPQKKLRCLTPAVCFLNTVPKLNRSKLSCK